MSLTLEHTSGDFGMTLTNQNDFTISIDAGKAFGGEGKAFRPMELLSGGLASCLLIDLLNILRKQRIEFNDFKIDVEGVRKEGIPSPFTEIHLYVKTDAKINEDRLGRNIQLTLNKYCSVASSLDPAIKIKYSINQ